MATGKFLSFMPLYSIGAWGRFYGVYPFGYWWPNPYGWQGYAIYQRRHTWHGIICIKERYHNAAPRDVPWLASSQQKLAAGVSYWQGLDNSAKEIYNSYTYPIQMSGYNRFLHYYLKNLQY